VEQTRFDVAADEAYEDAMERAGRLLAIRPRSEREVRDRLAAAGCDPGVAERVVGRLRELRLLDDLAFARQWIDERSRRKGVGPAVLTAELRRKGVDPELAGAALAEAGLDETALATEQAVRLVGRVARRPLREQGARLHLMLLRRGFGAEAAESAVKAVLPPEGWD
jgi:regulatory protein